MKTIEPRDLEDPEVAAILDLETVPPVTTTRWFPRRKAQVVAAVEAGLLSIEEACSLYRLSLEEFLGWQRTIRKGGVKGLCVTRRRRFELDFSEADWAAGFSTPGTHGHA
jgi:hypothetical protein